MVSEKSSGKLDQIVARASRERVARDNSYRERALKMYPWVCGRCAREFDREMQQDKRDLAEAIIGAG